MTSEAETKDNHSIRSYYKDVKKTTVLSGDEQIKLAVRAKKGDRKAFDQLVECNLRFVISIAKEYTSSGIPLEDLISEGNIGLMDAVKRFDETKGWKFISYAVWWVRQSIMKSISDNRTNVRLPINKINSIHKIARAKDKLTQTLERTPNADEILAVAGVSESDLRSYVMDANFEFHIDEPTTNSEGGSHEDTLKGEDYEEMEVRMNYRSLRDELTRAMGTLSDRERDIISMYYGLSDEAPMTLREIGKALKLTNERVRQVMKDGIKRLRVFEKSIKLKEFLKVGL